MVQNQSISFARCPPTHHTHTRLFVLPRASFLQSHTLSTRFSTFTSLLIRDRTIALPHIRFLHNRTESVFSPHRYWSHSLQRSQLPTRRRHTSIFFRCCRWTNSLTRGLAFRSLSLLLGIWHADQIISYTTHVPQDFLLTILITSQFSYNTRFGIWCFLVIFRMFVSFIHSVIKIALLIPTRVLWLITQGE